MPLQSILTSRSNARLKVERYIDHTINQIVSRTTGLDPVIAQQMWTGDLSQPIIQRNTGLWAYDLRSQLTGYRSYRIGPWQYQAAGSIAITKKHLLQVAHYDQNWAGSVIRFVNADSTDYFETTIINQYPLAPPQYMTFEGNTFDLQVWLLQDELPSWVNIFPMIEIAPKYLPYMPMNANKSSGKLLPTISISQANPYERLYMGNHWWYRVRDAIANDGTDYERRHYNPNIHPYFYDVTYGDSGTPTLTLINNIFYIFGFLQSFGYGIQQSYDPAQIRFVNELIRQVDLAAGSPTGYTVNAVKFDTLQF